MTQKMGRPSQGRSERLQIQSTKEVLEWLEEQAKRDGKSVSDVGFSILNAAMIQERAIPMLEFNPKSQSYEATVNGNLIQVDSDEFAETEAHHIQTYLGEGMNQEQAEAKAWHEARVATSWL